MIVGLGIDIAEVPRIRQALERHGERLLNRLFTPAEIEYCRQYRNPYERFAARFAAKEAAMKALGTGWRRGIHWRDIEVCNLPTGKPCLKLTGKALEIFTALGGVNTVVSLTHTERYALAEVVIEAQHL